MQGQEYLTINPDTFSDASIWSYKELQKLCGKLALGGRGTRDSLEDKLNCWHRERVHTEEPEEEKFEMNVPGNNFSLLQINVEPSKMKGKHHSRRKSSIVGLSDTTEKVSPSILRPFTAHTPNKGILKKRPANLEMEAINTDHDHDNDFDFDTENNCEGARKQATFATTTPRKLAKLTFSPFNGVKVISHRHEDLFSCELFAGQ